MINIRIRDLEIAASASRENTWIEGSHRVKRRKDMKAVLWLIRDRVETDCMVWQRSVKSQIREWRAHNLLYALGIARKRTADVDLDAEPAWRRACFFVLSCLYLSS